MHPAFSKDEALPPLAEAGASLAGVEWLRGRSGLLPGPRQLARISQFLDPRWVNLSNPLSNCSYGECKARLWEPIGGERGDGRGGILEGYTNLVQADGAQYQVLEFRADCTCESAMAFASYAHTRALAAGAPGERLNDTDTVARNLLDHAFMHGGLQIPSAVNGAEADGGMGLLHWTMGGSNPGGFHWMWGDDNARALLGAMGTAARQHEPSSLPRPILPNFPVLARARPRCLKRSHMVLISPSACSERVCGGHLPPRFLRSILPQAAAVSTSGKQCPPSWTPSPQLPARRARTHESAS